MYEIMPLTRRFNQVGYYNPFALFDEMEKSFFGDGGKGTALGFKADIKDNGDSYELTADLPGFSKDDLKVEIEDGIMTISGERRSESEDKDDKGTYVRRERTYGSFSRSFDVSEVDADKVAVRYEDGVLTVDMPKKEEQKPTVRRLEIA